MSDLTFSTTVPRARAAGQRRDALRDAIVAGSLGTLLIVVTSPVRAEAAPTWRLTLPFVPSPGGPVFSATTFTLGVLLMGFGWFQLGTFAMDKRVSSKRRLRTVSLVIALWSVPIMVGPPLLSNDVYSYAAQGELGSRGYDPTRWGPIALGGGPFLRAADDVWHHNPSPYGPVWNKLAAKVVSTTGHDAARAVWGFRVVIALSVLLAGWAVARLAREVGVNPATAVALGIGNPLMLLHILGGIHNDGLMLALLVLGLLLARREHRWLALLVITAAAAVKLPAAVGLVYLGWNWREELDTRFKRFLGAGVAGVVGMFLIVMLSVEFRMGMGWLGALRGTSQIMSTFAPVTMSGMLASETLSLFGMQVSPEGIVTTFRAGGLLAAGALAWLLLYNCRRVGTELALGLTLVLVIVLGPVLWPWYLPPAVALLAASGAERYRPALTVACVSIALFVYPTSVGTEIGAARYQSLLGMLLVTVITAAALFAQWLFGEPVLPRAVSSWIGRVRRARASSVTQTNG